MAGPECMEAGSWSSGLMMPRYPDLIIFPLCLVRPRCLRESGQSRSRRSDQYQAGHTTPVTQHSLTPSPDTHVGQLILVFIYKYLMTQCLCLKPFNHAIANQSYEKVTPLLGCHHITVPCQASAVAMNVISLHKYLSRRS